jgi:hypothetical protein
MGKKFGSGILNEHFLELSNYRYLLFGLKMLKFFVADPDPGSGIKIPDTQHWTLPLKNTVH